MNKSLDHTIRSNDTHEMYFIYDQERDRLFIKHIIEKLNNPLITYDEFIRVSDEQLHATLVFKAPNLPIYEIDLAGEIEINYLGKVE